VVFLGPILTGSFFDQSPQKSLPGGCAKKGIVLVFRYINADE
jgi:hypothetical protein